MPTIKSSTDLCNSYNEISALCHQTREPIFITKNGQGDLAILSIESFDALNAKLDLYSALDKGYADIQNSRKMPYSDFTAQLRNELEGK